MKSDIQRINNIIGQLEGVKRMLEDGRPCFDVLPQLKASSSALKSTVQQYLTKEMQTCLSVCSKKEQRSEVCETFINELLKTI